MFDENKVSRLYDLDDQNQPIRIDDLLYQYNDIQNPNRLSKVTDRTQDPSGFSDDVADVNDSNDDYVYDDFGNMIADANKGIVNIVYNHLNLPILIDFGSTGTIGYIYNAVGQKVRKTVYNGINGSIEITDYLDGFQYKNDNLLFFPHAEGYVNCNAPKLLHQINPEGMIEEVLVDDKNPVFSYVYNYTDHLGNIRLSYSKNPQNGQLTIIEENHYYPFGLKHNNYNSDTNMYVKEQEQLKIKPVPLFFKPTYNYKYNGKELQDELGLNMYDYGARNYDPALGRWMNIDPLSEMSFNLTPYRYSGNNPIIFKDPDGMLATPPTDLFNTDGKKIGTDGVDNKERMLVTNDDEAKKISNTKGNIDLSTVKSGEMLEDNSVLQESLNVIERTENNGGLSEESSLVMNDNSVVTGQTGSPVDLAKDSFAGTSLPNIPNDKTTTDVKATIHSHVIGCEVVNGEIKSMSATEPSVGANKDTGTFAKYKTNIIVGRLGKTTADLTQQSVFNKTVSTNKPNLGVSVFRGDSTTPAYSLTKRAVEKILKQ